MKSKQLTERLLKLLTRMDGAAKIKGEPGQKHLVRLKRKSDGLLKSIKNAIITDFFPERKNPGCKCPACGQWFQTWTSLGKHFAHKHTKTVFTPDGKVQTCAFCVCGQRFVVKAYGQRGMTSLAKLGAHLAKLKDPAAHLVLGALANSANGTGGQL